jgi:hypothetical protein
MKCLGCTCLWFSFVFKQTNEEEINLKIICHHKNETEIKIFFARRGQKKKKKKAVSGLLC